LSTGWVSASLAEKIPEQAVRKGLGPLRQFLDGESRGLQVQWEFSLRKNWLDVKAAGDDAEVFLNVLRKRFGTIPVQLSKVEKWDLARGSVTGSGKVGFGVYVDLGIFEPVARDSLYPLHRMRAQLADGASKPCREILEENGLVDEFPLEVRVLDIQGEKISAELSDGTRDMFNLWRRLPFDRVVAIGVGESEAERAVKAAGLWYDVIRIEPLSVFVQCLVCKIGTEAPGVIAKLGTRLRGVKLASVRTRTHPFEKRGQAQILETKS